MHNSALHERVPMVGKNGKFVGLNKKHIGFLDKISSDCKESGGKKFSRTSVLKALLRASKNLKIEVDKGEKSLELIIVKAFKSIDLRDER
jgi:hypothetical protein